jgi:hypothetical protein
MYNCEAIHEVSPKDVSDMASAISFFVFGGFYEQKNAVASHGSGS